MATSVMMAPQQKERSSTADYIAKGIISALDGYMTGIQQMKQQEQNLILDEVKRQRDAKYKREETDYAALSDPIKMLQMRDMYSRGEITDQDIAGTPWEKRLKIEQQKIGLPDNINGKDDIYKVIKEKMTPGMSMIGGGEGTISGQPIQQPSQKEKDFVFQYEHPVTPQEIKKMIPEEPPKGKMRNPEYRSYLKEPKYIPDPDYVGEKQQKLIDSRDRAYESTLYKEFVNDINVKDYKTVSVNAKAIEAVAKKAFENPVKENLNAYDQTMITLFNKLTDPQSVVRESEYERFGLNLSLVNRIIGSIEKIQKGGAGITDDDRKNLLMATKIIMDTRGAAYNERLDNLKNTAAQYDLPPERVSRGAEAYVPYSQREEETQGTNKYIKTGTLPDGRRVGVLSDGTSEIINE